MKSTVTVNVVDLLRAWYAQVVGQREAQPEHRAGFNAVLSEALGASTNPSPSRPDDGSDDGPASGTDILLSGLFDTVHALGNSFNGEASRAEFNESALAALVSLLLNTLSRHHDTIIHPPHDGARSNNNTTTATTTTTTTPAHDTNQHHEDPKNLQPQKAAATTHNVPPTSTVSTASLDGKLRSVGGGTTQPSTSSLASGARERIGSALITIVMPKDHDAASGDVVDLRSTVPVAAATTAAQLVLLPTAAVDAANFDPLSGGDASLRFAGGFQQWSEDGTSAESQRNQEKTVVMTPQAVLHGDDDSSIGTEAPGCHGGGGGGGGDGHMYEVNQYLMLKRLGRGSQGEVYLAVDSDTDAVRAIKIIPRPAAGTRVSAARRAKLEHLKREVGIMKRLRHRNVVSLHEVIDDPATDKLYLVMDYIEHGPVATMTDAGAVSRTVDPVLLANYGRQLCAALQYLHRHGVIHRDIKPDNILVGQHDHVFVSDFGVSDAFDDGSLARAVSGTRGTPAFLAPELLKAGLEAAAAAATNGSAGSGSDSDEGGLRGKPAAAVDGEAVDTWALGMTLYVLLYGKLPWEFADAQDLFDAIQRRPIELRPQAAVVRAPRPPTSTSDLFLASVASPSGARFMAGGRVAPVAVQASSPPMTVPTAPPESAVNEGSSSPPTPFRRATSHRTPSQHNAREQLGASSNSNSVNVASSSDVGALPCFDMDNSVIDNTVFVRGEDRGRRPSSTFAASLSDVSVQFGSATSFIVAGSSPTTALGMMPSAAADEGWRRILHGMLQRDPKRRTPLGEVRKQLVTLEVRMEEATRYNASQRSLVDEGAKAAFTARR